MKTGCAKWKRVIVLFISCCLLSHALFLTAFSESQDCRGFNPETNTTYTQGGIAFSIPGYYTLDKHEERRDTFWNGITDETILVFVHDYFDTKCDKTTWIDGFMESVQSRVENKNYNIAAVKIAENDGFIISPEESIVEGWPMVIAVIFQEGEERVTAVSFGQADNSSTNYFWDFTRMLWTAHSADTQDSGYTPYPAEEYYGLQRIPNIGKLPEKAYSSPDEAKKLTNLLFYVDGTVISVGTWRDICEAIGNKAPEADKSGDFVAIRNQDGVVWVTVPTEADYALPKIDENVRFYGQYVEFNEETKTVGLNGYPEYKNVPDGNENKEEILFRNIPWGTDYDDVVSQIPEVTFYPFTGEIYKTYSVDQIITGDGLRFECKDININGSAISGSLSVAGYQTTDVDLYFAYVPVNGALTKEKEDSAFYGASYEFTPEDTKGMASDLKEKLTSIYGEASKTTQEKDLWGGIVKYTYWYGANDTLLVLCVDDESASSWKSTEKIRIVYAWREGDKLLQEASDCLKREAVANEKSKFGNGNTNGL